MSELITYQVEKFDTCWPELREWLHTHWLEVGTNRDMIPMDPNEDAYRDHEAKGQLHIVTARRNGALIGYHASLVMPHLHYKSTLMSFTDVYFIGPKYRKGWVAIRLFREAERTLKARGVKKMFSGTKTFKDMSRLFEFLGWKHQEHMFAKFIGG